MDPAAGPVYALYITEGVPASVGAEVAEMAAGNAGDVEEAPKVVLGAGVTAVTDVPYHAVLCVVDELPAAKARFKAAGVFVLEPEEAEVEDEAVMVVGPESLEMMLDATLWQPPVDEEDDACPEEVDDDGVHRIVDGVYLTSLLGARKVAADDRERVLLSLLDRDEDLAALTPPQGSLHIFMEDSAAVKHQVLSNAAAAVNFIAAAAAGGRGVVVHCQAGRSRSASMVACYLMHAGHAATAAVALEMIREARPWVEPNPQFRHELEVYETVVRGAAPAVPFSFAPHFAAPIVAGEKRATARRRNAGDDAALAGLAAGALLQATADGAPFATLVVTAVEERAAGAVDDALAATEGLGSAAELTAVLKTFYPDLTPADPLVVVHFACVRA